MSKKLVDILVPGKWNFFVYAPSDWDYWESDGKRVNFRIKKMQHPENPSIVGISVIIGLFHLGLAWVKKRTSMV